MIRSKLYKSCSDLTMDRFIRLNVNNDLKALIKRQGLIKPRRGLLERVYSEILQSYSDLSSNDTSNAYLSLLKQKTLLNNKIQLIKIGLMSLSERRNEELIKVLRSMGLKSTFKKETYKKDLERSLNQLKSMISKLNKIEKNLRPFMTGQEMTEKDYVEIFTVLSKFQGYRIKPEEVTVLEFVNLINNFKKWQTPKK